MPVADTELLFFLNPTDPRHARAVAVLKQHPVSVPDTALFEFLMVLRAKGIRSPEAGKMVLSVTSFLRRYGAAFPNTLGPELLAHAAALEEEHSLSFFDSLIAASCLRLDKVVLSDDAAFNRVPGMQRISIAEK